ncbi:P27 family phage terminase small subunit [Acetobacter orientalis]|uniref:P27 family phage terminase small subunit n=1 Tax=Acetobacter orientalis TaxID=146474 RepID=UPI0039EAF169
MEKTNYIKKYKRLSDLWDEILPLIGMTYELKPQDCFAVEQFIILLDRFYQTSDEILKRGTVIESTDNKSRLDLRANPATKTNADTGRQLIAYFNRFGLSEWDRKRGQKQFGTPEDDVDLGNFDDLK